MKKRLPNFPQYGVSKYPKKLDQTNEGQLTTEKVHVCLKSSLIRCNLLMFATVCLSVHITVQIFLEIGFAVLS